MSGNSAGRDSSPVDSTGMSGASVSTPVGGGVLGASLGAAGGALASGAPLASLSVASESGSVVPVSEAAVHLVHGLSMCFVVHNNSCSPCISSCTCMLIGGSFRHVQVALSTKFQRSNGRS